MEKPFAAYSGDEPYVFVCYAHDDQDVIYPEIASLHERGVNLWYDEGISAGHNWRAVIGDSLLGADRLLCYISPRSLTSDHCNREINLALDEGKDIVPVYLESVDLTSDLKVGLNRVQAIHRYELDGKEYENKLGAALNLSPRAPAEPVRAKSRNWAKPLAALTVAALVATAVLIYRAPTDELDDRPQTSQNDAVTAIAVMPFDDLSPDGDQGWLANGMAEEIIESLSRIEGLRVPNRNSTSALKNLKADMTSVGERLNVGSAVQGSLRRSGNQISVLAQWIRVADGARLWSARYERSLDDVFAVQSEIAMGIAEAIRTELGIHDTTNSLSQHRYATSDVRAWELVQRANPMLISYEPAKVAEAQNFLRRAIQLDPNYAQAHALLAFSEFENPERRIQGARYALELEPTNTTAYQIIILDSMEHWDFETAETLLDQSVAAKPQDSFLMPTAFGLYFAYGRVEEALEAAKRGVRLDPLLADLHARLGWGYFAVGNYSAAIESLEFAYSLSVEAGQGITQIPVAGLYWYSDRKTDALEAMVRDWPDLEREIRTGWETNGWQGANVAVADATQGDAVYDWSRRGWALARAGSKEAMYAIIEERVEAVDRNAHFAAAWLKSDGEFSAYRKEPRFQELIQQVDQRIADAAGTYKRSLADLGLF